MSSKGSRDDWGRRRHDSVERDREQDIRSYDSIDMLRDRTESEVYRDNRYYSYSITYIIILYLYI